MSASDFVTLTAPSHALTVPRTVLDLFRALEDRGIRLKLADDDTSVCAPPGRLTDAERRVIKRYRPHVRAVLALVAEMEGRVH